jgi:hypothetical protein
MTPWRGFFLALIETCGLLQDEWRNSTTQLMDQSSLRKFRDRLRIITILYVFCERLNNDDKQHFGVFRTEVKIQALDFLLRYPDFLCLELLNLMDSDPMLSRVEIQKIIEAIYVSNEPELRVEEMEKFFHGAYENIDDVIAFLVSVGFIEHESKKRTDGKTYDKIYYLTNLCATKVETSLINITSIKWYFERCSLIKTYFNQFTGTDLKKRQYRYAEYSNVSYRQHIANVNDKVKATFTERFNKPLQ